MVESKGWRSDQLPASGAISKVRCRGHSSSARGTGVDEASAQLERSDDQRARRGREDQLVLSLALAPPDAAGAGHRGSDPGWAAAGGDDVAGADGAVPGRVGGAARPRRPATMIERGTKSPDPLHFEVRAASAADDRAAHRHPAGINNSI